jgi:fatty acid synthase, animal type
MTLRSQSHSPASLRLSSVVPSFLVKSRLLDPMSPATVILERGAFRLSLCPADANGCLITCRVFGIDCSKQGNIHVCNRSQVALIPLGMHQSTAAAIVGRLCFISSVITKAISSAAVKTPRILLHAGNSSPAAIATYVYLKANSFDVMVTVRDLSNLRMTVDTSHLPIHTSSPCDAWSFRVREWAEKGVDVVFNFDNDPDVTKETFNVLSARGSLVQIGGDLPRRVQRGHTYISVDFRQILLDKDIVQSALEIIQPTSRACFTPPVEIFELGQLSAAQARSRESSVTDTTVLLDLQTIDSTLPILRGGVIRGTSAFSPRASYVVIGGVGGLGASITRCLIENGARHIVLTSRSGENVSNK